MITEYEGWKSGDVCYTVFRGESKPSMCDVLEFFPKDDIAASVSLREISSGMYRVAAVEAISDNAKEAKKVSAKWEKWYTEYVKSLSKK